jgi:hypothetical protein
MISSRRMMWTGHVGDREEECTEGFVGKLEGKRPPGRPRPTWEDNIKMDIREIGYSVDWVNLAQDRDQWRVLVDTIMNLRVS